MRIIHTIISFAVLCSTATIAQVGIGTVSVDPSAIADISSETAGLLVPQLSNLDRASILTPAYGLIIFNSDNQTLEYNTGTPLIPNWVSVNTQTPVLSSPAQSAKFSNTDITLNINNGADINAPLFGAEEWNDNTSLFTITDQTLTVNEGGRFKLIANISIASNSNAGRKTPEAFFAVNGTQMGAFATSGYMRRASGHESSSMYLAETLNLSAGDIITVKIRRAGGGSTAILRSVNSSNFYIEKIDN